MRVVIPFMYQRKALFYREKASNMYDAKLFAMSGGIVELPFIFIEAALAVNILYWLVGLGPSSAHEGEAWWLYLYYWLLHLLHTLCMTFTGQALTFLLPNAASATLVAALINQVLGLFAGVTVPGAQIPSYLLWLSYITPLRWSTEGVVTTQMQYFDVPMCYPSGTPDEATKLCMPLGSGIYTTTKAYVLGDPTTEPGDEGYPGFLGGSNGYRYEHRFYDLLYLACFTVLMRLLAFYAAARISYNKR